MKTGRPKTPMILCAEDQSQLIAIANSRSLPHALVTRAKIVLMAAEGQTNHAIAQKVSLSQQMVCKWRQRFIKQGLAGLHDELRSGRPRSISDEEVSEIVHKTLKSKPPNATHWTIRSLEKETETT